MFLSYSQPHHHYLKKVRRHQCQNHILNPAQRVCMLQIIWKLLNPSEAERLRLDIIQLNKYGARTHRTVELQGTFKKHIPNVRNAWLGVRGWCDLVFKLADWSFHGELGLSLDGMEGNRESSRHGRFRISNIFPVLGHPEQISMAGDPRKEGRQNFVRVHTESIDKTTSWFPGPGENQCVEWTQLPSRQIASIMRILRRVLPRVHPIPSGRQIPLRLLLLPLDFVRSSSYYLWIQEVSLQHFQ